MRRAQRRLGRMPNGDRQMVDILGAVRGDRVDLELGRGNGHHDHRAAEGALQPLQGEIELRIVVHEVHHHRARLAQREERAVVERGAGELRHVQNRSFLSNCGSRRVNNRTTVAA